jgi:hypothetical protein
MVFSVKFHMYLYMNIIFYIKYFRTPALYDAYVALPFHIQMIMLLLTIIGTVWHQDSFQYFHTVLERI